LSKISKILLFILFYQTESKSKIKKAVLLIQW